MDTYFEVPYLLLPSFFEVYADLYQNTGFDRRVSARAVIAHLYICHIYVRVYIMCVNMCCADLLLSLSFLFRSSPPRSGCDYASSKIAHICVRIYYVCKLIRSPPFFFQVYADFYKADLIVASPLGLRLGVGAAGESRADADWLSSIEVRT